MILSKMVKWIMLEVIEEEEQVNQKFKKKIIYKNYINKNGQMDYVRSARARGTSESKIYNKHILINSIIPLITFLGFDLATLIGGAVITETIFTYPGIGMLFIESIDSRDYALVMTLTMIFSLLTLIG